MFSPTRTALYVAISAMALAANEANAGCKTISGSYICADWITGSEICNVKFGGLPSDAGNPSLTASLECRVYGDSTVNGQACLTNQAPPGQLICDTPTTDATLATNLKPTPPATTTTNTHANHFCKHDSKTVGHSDGSCQPADLPGGITVLSSGPTPVNCDAQGTCTGSAEVPPDGSLGVCGVGGILNFTADHFIGEVIACSNKFTSTGDGCEGGLQGNLWQQCQRSGNNYVCQDLAGPPPNCNID